MEDKIKFEKKVIGIGNSQGVTLPIEILNYLDNPEELIIMPDKSKYGKFIAIWNKRQGEQKNEM